MSDRDYINSVTHDRRRYLWRMGSTALLLMSMIPGLFIPGGIMLVGLAINTEIWWIIAIPEQPVHIYLRDIKTPWEISVFFMSHPLSARRNILPILRERIRCYQGLTGIMFYAPGVRVYCRIQLHPEAREVRRTLPGRQILFFRNQCSS